MLHVSRCAYAAHIRIKGANKELLSIVFSCEKQAKNGLTSGLGSFGLGAGRRLGKQRLQGGQLLLREYPCRNIFQSLHCRHTTPASISAVHLHTLP